MRILSNNECEMVSGGHNIGETDGETREAERNLKEWTGKQYHCTKVPGQDGPELSCHPVQSSPNVFLG